MPSSIVLCSSLFYMKHRYSSGKSNMWRSQQLNSPTVKVNMICMIHCFSFLDLSEQTLGKYITYIHVRVIELNIVLFRFPQLSCFQNSTTNSLTIELSD